MNKGLYGRLAVVNMRNNKQFYLPYLLTGILTVAMFYIMCALKGNKGLDQLPGTSEVKVILGMGTVIIGIFAVIFLFYTNSFIIKRRKKELGVYNILGMEKRHLAKVLFLETLLTALFAVGGGLITGIVFNKLMCMLLYKLIGYGARIEFYISGVGIQATLILFLSIYLLTLLYNMMQIKLANPIELLHGGNVGEREPKTKVLLAIVGVLAIGAGYYIAITTKSPLNALVLFFWAVLLVIIGTYSLFTAGSIAILKLLRKNKNYYYKARHFTAVSGMLYRMKQNAVGLANICILSTMVLIMVSGTVSLYFGVEDELKSRYPTDISVYAHYDSSESLEKAADWEQDMEQIIAQNGRKIINKTSYAALSFAAVERGNDNQFLIEEPKDFSADNITMFTVITRETCKERFDYELEPLAEKEIYLMGTNKMDTATIGGQKYDVKNVLEFNHEEDSVTGSLYSYYFIVVNDSAGMEEFYHLQKQAYGEEASNYIYSIYLDIDGTDEEKVACGEAVRENLRNSDNASFAAAYCECRQANAGDFRAMHGGFLFLGLFLGGMFLMITVLIIFYKQISEGYDDKERFAIMEKVGMSNEEVKASIRSQVRTVFLLPIITAAIHVFAAFPMVKRLLAVMNLTNGGLFAWCMAGTIVVFLTIYLLVFWLTSKTYYRIVGAQV